MEVTTEMLLAKIGELTVKLDLTDEYIRELQSQLAEKRDPPDGE
jgi:hypothetical protein